MTGSSSNNDGNPEIVDFDDGHIPENFAGSANAQKTQLVRYKGFVDERTAMVHVIDDALPPALVDAIYDVTATVSDKPWGTYVTREQLNDYRTKHINSNNDNAAETSMKMDSPQDRPSLAVAAAAYYLDHALQQQKQSKTQEQSSRVKTYTSPNGSSSPSVPRQTCLWTDSDHDTIFHGVAVWALASTQGAHVPYHLDYAEQIRYERNLIVPPLLAGTLQCTRTTCIKGGDLGVCFGGLEHYHKHGYKGAKQEKSDNININKEEENKEDWITVPYRYNRMIIKSGHLPHHSTRVEVLEPPTQKRVIVGFNVFGQDYGPLVQQAPEHSEVFRRKVALQRALLHSTSASSKKSGGGISVQALQANKGLSKLLVLAKRAKIKYELAQAQQQLDENLDDYLMKSATTKENGVTVEALMKMFGNEKGGWPSPVDVQVHINQRMARMSQGNGGGDQENRRRRLCLQTDTVSSSDVENHTKNRMVTPRDVVFLAPEQVQ